jgi:hypothetical protein
VPAGVRASDVERGRVVELAGITVGRAVEHHGDGAGGMSTPPTVVGTRASRKSPLTGLSIRNVSSMKLLESRVFGEDLQGGTHRRTVVS